MKVEVAKSRDALYPDRNLNVFVAYGGRPYDNNLIRALVATLRWSEPELARDFVREMSGLEAPSGTKFLFDLEACDYDDFRPDHCQKRVVLGISRAGEIASDLPPLEEMAWQDLLLLAESSADPKQKLDAFRQALSRPDLDQDELETVHESLLELSRGAAPDGWIIAPDASVCVLIEAFAGRYVDASSVLRHGDMWFGKRQIGDWLRLASWRKVAEFVRTRRDQAKAGSTTRFLLSQLYDYLDMLDLAPFDGFRPYDFDAKDLARTLPKFREFVQAVKEEAVAKGAPIHPEAPAWSDGGFVARLHSSERKAVGDVAIGYGENGIDVSLLVGAGKSGTSDFAGRFGTDRLLELTGGASAGTSAASAAALEGAVAKLERPYHVRVLRTAGQTQSVRRFQEVLRRDLGASALGEAIAQLRQVHADAGGGPVSRPTGVLAITHAIPVDDAVSGRSELVSRTAGAVRELSRLLGSISRPV